MRIKANEQRLATLLSIVGYGALHVYNAFYWDENEPKTIENVIIKFRTYCKPKKNVTYERFVFMSRKQKSNESINDYLVALRNLIKQCEYGSLTDSILKDAIVMGLRNKKTQEILLREADLNLDKCINIVQAAERAHNHSYFIAQEKNNDESMDIDKVTASNNNEKPKRCKFCGNEHVWGRKHCPAFGKSCSNCGGSNHFMKVCKTKKNKISMVEEENEFEIH